MILGGGPVYMILCHEICLARIPPFLSMCFSSFNVGKYNKLRYLQDFNKLKINI
jgi:hypothetical protein